MIKTLQKRFIAIAMASMATVLLIMIGGINIANYINVLNTTNDRLMMIVNNHGKFPEAGDKKPFNHPAPMKQMPAEAEFDTRFFTVTIDSSGMVVNTDTGKIAAISTNTANEFATQLYDSNQSEGFYRHYKYTAITNNNHTMYIFLDCERELNSFEDFLIASVIFSIAGLLLVFILVVFFSGKLVKPIAESYEKQKQFITDASHEIKTPLTIIDANTEIIEMTSGENEWTHSIRNQIKRMTSLTEKLVFLSRMDEENNTLNVADFSLSDAILDTAEGFASVAATKNKKLNIDVTPELKYMGDEGAIRQLISLLIDNSIKYSTDNSEIHLSLKQSGKNRIITLTNEVESIEIGNHDILFERFYRRDSSRSTATGGYGIGLSVAKAIVINHKGKISARSDDGKNIIFSIIL